MENNASNLNNSSRFTDMNPKSTKNYLPYIVGGIAIVVVILLIVFILRNNQAATSNSTSTNNTSDSSQNSDSNDTSVVSEPVTNPGSDSTPSSSANTLSSEDVTYSSTALNLQGKDYTVFDSCDNTKSICSHYLLFKDNLGDYPILTSAVDTQSFLISGELTDSPGGNAAGNEYFVLSDKIVIEAVATYVDKEVDPDNSAINNYVFSSCAVTAPPCNKYLVKESLVSGIPFVSTLATDANVAFSGELTDGGGAAGSHYWKMKTITIEKL